MIDSYQIASGVTTPIIENLDWKVDYINSVWISHLIKELQEYNIQIKIENLFKIEPQRTNDTNIMENELSSTTKNSLTTNSFNACRIHLGINFLSGLCNANGNELKHNLINYDQPEISQYRIRWPNQPKPHEKYWKAWTNIINNRYCKVRSLHLKNKYIICY